MDEERSSNYYKSLAWIPMIVFLILYVGSGLFFTILGYKDPFEIISRYAAIIVAISIAFIFFDRKAGLDKKVDIYTKGAGRSGVMMLGIIILLAGAFSTSAEAMGGQESMVNLGLTLIPSDFLIPGIFLITSIISTSIGTSMGTQVTMIPIAIAISEGAGIDPALAGAATIAGAYFGDNLSMISDATIASTKGVGANLKDKFRSNLLIVIPPAILTVIMYWFVSLNASTETANLGTLDFNILEVLPYIFVLGSAVAGMNVVVVLILGIAMSGVIGLTLGTFSLFDLTKAISDGMESMFWLFVFASLVSGLIELIRYYGGVDWLVATLAKRIKGSKSTEYIISVITMGLAGSTLNNTIAVLITAPIAKIMGEEYRISKTRLATLLSIFSCVILMVVPHDSGILLVQGYSDATYFDILKYSFYPIFLFITTVLTTQFGILRRKEYEEN